jgi:hypothetical protein
MATGYTRNDTTNNIANGNVINANDLDGEFDAIQAAYDVTTGHDHDGTVGGGAPIKALGPAQDIVITTSVIRPKTDNTVDLGTSTLEFKDLFIDGTANIDSLVADTADINGGTVDGAVIGGSSAAAGTFTTATATTGNITTVNATTVDTTNIEVTNIKAKDGTASATIADTTGVMTVASAVLTTADINGGTVDNATIATSDITVGAGKTLNVSAGTLTLADNQISGDKVEGGTINAITINTLGSTTGNITTVNATTVDTTNIEVTTLKAKDGTSAGSIADSTGVVTLASSVLTTTDINGGTVDGAVIGGSSAAAITGTTITATGDVTIADKIIHAGDTNTAIRFPAADTVTVETSGAERLRVDSSGNVGVGTASPGHRLDVSAGQATVKIGSSTTSAGNEPAILLEHAGNNTFQIKGGANLIFSSDAGTNERMRITTAGNVGIGTSTANYRLNVAGPGVSGNAAIAIVDTSNSNKEYRIDQSVGQFRIIESGVAERLILSSGNLGLAVTPSAWAGIRAMQLVDGRAAFSSDGISTWLSNNWFNDGTDKYVATAAATIYRQASGVHQWFNAPSGTAGNAITFTQAMTLDASGNFYVGTTSQSGGSNITFNQPANADMKIAAAVSTGTRAAYQVFVNNTVTTVGTENSTGGSLASGTSAYSTVLANSGAYPISFATNNTERVRIDSSGNLLVGKTSTAFETTGGRLAPSGEIIGTVNGGTILYVNRLTSDGNLVEFSQSTILEGTISVSGTTVSYNGGHLSRWAQFPDNSRPELLKGTVMSNLDQMSNWDQEDNEQLNCVQVSAVEGDANVAGVFVAWDSTDDDYNDILLAMTGDMVIRIAGGTTVQRGDLLMSAGDGTAKPQGDDIVRSKTIAKVTSTHVSHTYADGSYAVPCVLMAC